MQELWLYDIERTPGNDAGSYVGAPWRGVLHTTQGPDGSLQGAVDTLRAHNSWSHLTIDPLRKRIAQHLSLHVPARSLQHGNRHNAIQIEIVGLAEQSPNWPQEKLHFIAWVMRQIYALVPIPSRADQPFEAYPASSGVNNGVRLTDQQWQSFSGWCGHQHVPGNDHGDPGNIDVGFLFAPEHNVRPAEVKGGSVTAIANDASSLSFFAVRQGQLRHVIWNTSTQAATLLPTTHHGVLFNSWAQLAQFSKVPSGGVTPQILALGQGDQGFVWPVFSYRRVNNGWSLVSGIGGAALGSVMRPDASAGITAATRTSNSLDIFVVSYDEWRVFNCWAQEGQASTDFVEIPGPTVNALAGLAAVSRTPGWVDVFMIDENLRLHTSFSMAPQTWSPAFPIGDPSLVAHRLSRIAVTSRNSDNLDVFVIGKQSMDTDWLLYDTWWRPISGWWDPLLGHHTQPIGGSMVKPHPMGGIAALTRTPEFIDVFVLGKEDRLLYNTWWGVQPNRWSDFRQIGGIPYTPNGRLASVDAAIARSGNSVDVVVTGMDGNVYVTSWTAGQADYSQFRRLEHLVI